MGRKFPPFAAVRAFEAAARRLSFKEAAEELCVSPSAISHQIRTLEEFLDTALFKREGSGLTRSLRDVQRLSGRRPRPTFPSRVPLFRLDHIFIDDAFDLVRVEVPSDVLARTASDHLPLIAQLSLRN